MCIRDRPTDESNNQFFVWKFPDISSKRDGHFLKKLKERLGHYIRTELISVYDGIDKNFTRYGINVPITEYEKELFNSNVTNVESSSNLALERIINFYEKYVKSYGCVTLIDDYGRPDPRKPTDEEMRLLRDGFLAFSLLQKFANNNVHPNTMIKNLKKRDIVIDATRKIINSQKFTCYEIIDSKYRV